ncbi:MAG TPA: hypothetical protein VFA89_01020 [Terriglobales bacterium]|nr:hypothetical protein [Terriglobales bacterium]
MFSQTKIIHLIACPRWETFLSALSNHSIYRSPHRFWNRPCQDCGNTLAVSAEVLQEVQADPNIRLVCEDCTTLGGSPQTQ